MKTDFAATRQMFDLPQGMVYLDGNSLGPLPHSVKARLAHVVQQEWGNLLIQAWNKAGWMDQPGRIGNRIATLIGAEPGSVVMGDTLSIKVYQALTAALAMNPARRVILSDSGNFPSDLYIAQGLVRTLGDTYQLRVVEPDQVIASIDESVAVTLVTEVDYRTGSRHDMAAITLKAHEKGALSIWDLAHSAGAFPVHLARDGADFAVGCTYKYLNAGPGGPAFIYVAPGHGEHIQPALAGWMGHEAPFAFDLTYAPGRGIERMRVGTPPILQLAALEAALDVWDNVDLDDLRERSLALGDQFITGVEAACPELQLATPRAHDRRGSQVSFRHPQGYAIMQALIAEGVVGDFRAPDILRFGFTPLYIDASDVARAVDTLASIMGDKRWTAPAFQKKERVT